MRCRGSGSRKNTELVYQLEEKGFSRVGISELRQVDDHAVFDTRTIVLLHDRGSGYSGSSDAIVLEGLNCPLVEGRKTLRGTRFSTGGFTQSLDDQCVVVVLSGYGVAQAHPGSGRRNVIGREGTNTSSWVRYPLT